jgi:CubicO group peptidase (beta-lactamase class C family)
MLSKIISITTGKRLDDYLDEKIFQQLDIPKPKWDASTKGVPLGFSGLYLTAEQLSRFGQLILDIGFMIILHTNYFNLCAVFIFLEYCGNIKALENCF